MTATYHRRVIISTISPYCLPWATLPLNRGDRGELLRDVGRSIAADIPGLGAPLMVPIRSSEFRTRKSAILKFEVGSKGPCAEHVSNFPSLPWTTHTFLNEDTYYFDCGAGFTEVRSAINFDSFDDLIKNRTEFRDHYKSLMRSLCEENRLFHLRHWHEFSGAFRKAFSDFSISFDEWLLQYADKNYGWGENFFFFSDDDNIADHQKALGHVANSVLSDVVSIKEAWVDRFDLLISAQNYDGGFHVLRKFETVDSAILHVGISSAYWCIFKSSYESLLRRYETLPLFGQKAYQFEDDFTSLQASRIFLDYCISDSSPRLLAWNNFDSSLYEGLWKAWDVDSLIVKLNDRMDGLYRIFDGMRKQMETRTEKNAAIFLFSINCFAIIGLITQLLSFYDFDTNRIVLDRPIRAFLILGSLTFTAFFGSLLAYWLYFRK